MLRTVKRHQMRQPWRRAYTCRRKTHLILGPVVLNGCFDIYIKPDRYGNLAEKGLDDSSPLIASWYYTEVTSRIELEWRAMVNRASRSSPSLRVSIRVDEARSVSIRLAEALTILRWLPNWPWKVIFFFISVSISSEGPVDSALGSYKWILFRRRRTKHIHA